MNDAVEKKWADVRDALQKELAGTADIDVRIPHWQPVDLATGLRWLQSAIYEGYYVGFKVSRSPSKTTVWLKSWEFGEKEPAWMT